MPFSAADSRAFVIRKALSPDNGQVPGPGMGH